MFRLGSGGMRSRGRLSSLAIFVLAMAVPASPVCAQDICATIFINPDTVTDGQVISVVVDVMNCSLVDITAVGPTGWGVACPFPGCIATAASGTASVTPVSGPTPAGTTDLVEFGHALFTWQFKAMGNGTVDFTVTVSGWRSGSSTEYASTSALTVQMPAALSVTLYSSAPAGVVKYLQSVAIYMDVFNYGESRMDFTHAMTQSMTGTALLCPAPCPSDVVAPLCPPDPTRRLASIAGGSATRFTWLYTAMAPGTVVVSTAAAGTDHNFPALPQGISNTASITLTVPMTSAFVLTVTGPERVVQGEPFDLKVMVTNGGATPERVCQSGFLVTLNGAVLPSCASSGQVLAAQAVLEDLADNLLPQCFTPGQTKEFTLRITPPAELGAITGNLTVEAIGVVAATGDSVYSLRAGWPIEIVSGTSRICGIDHNPFRPLKDIAMTVCFIVAPDQADRPVSVRIYNLNGELMRTLVDERKSGGVYDAVWDGRDSRGRMVASGIYMVLFRSHASKHLRKIAVIK